MISDEMLDAMIVAAAGGLPHGAMAPFSMDDIGALAREVHELRARLERARSWAGLMEVLDGHYPASVFAGGGGAGDEGVRIVVLTRALDGFRTAAAHALEAFWAAADTIDVGRGDSDSCWTPCLEAMEQLAALAQEGAGRG